MIRLKQHKFVIISALIIVALTVVAYWNVYDNGFHFDDSHTVEKNVYIRDLGNFKQFFTDATTISTLPANQQYRPMFTLSLAVDYWLAGGRLDPFFFHFSMVFAHMLQSVLLILVFIKIMKNAGADDKIAKWTAVVASGFYAIHTVHAETISYVSSRSDSFSTFWMVVALLMYLYFPKKRKFLWYVLPLAVSIMIKPATLVFAPLLFVYHYFVEQKGTFASLARIEDYKSIFKALIPALPSLLVCLFLFWFQNKMTPETFTPSQTTHFNYIITQPFVFFKYLWLFIYPNQLTADTDVYPLNSVINWKFLIGLSTVIVMLWFVNISSKFTDYRRVISFGILWFFIALLPTSSIIPFSEVMNDHRIYFPNIGLALSFSVFMVGIFQSDNFITRRLKSKMIKGVVSLTLLSGLIFSHVYGTMVRVDVWQNGLTLWKDVSLKSPNNGRGWMNYGLALMQKGDMEGAEKAYMEAQKRIPYYSYLHMNLGVLRNAQGRIEEAKQHYKNAVSYDPGNPETYYFYGWFLNTHGFKKEAIANYEKTIAIAAGHQYANYALMDLYYEQNEMENLKIAINRMKRIDPNDAKALAMEGSISGSSNPFEAIEKTAIENNNQDELINLSLKFYHKGEFQECIRLCKIVVSINPDNAIAHNNICSSYIQIKKYKLAEEACLKAIEINADFELAKNNLKLAKDQQ